MLSETNDKEKLDGKETPGLKTHRNDFFYLLMQFIMSKAK